MNKKRQVLLIACLFFVNIIASLPAISSNSELSTKGYDIVIPDDYPTIQEGVDNANAGNAIFVRAGVYKEHTVISKEGILLRGEDKNITIIDAENNEYDAVTITAEGVKVEGFTITNARCRDKLNWDQAGIKIYSSNATIKNNRLVNNRIGVEAYSVAHNLTIVDNEFYDDGILLGNYIDSGVPHFTMWDFLHDIRNNTVMGKPLYYYTHENDFTVPSDAGLLILVNCTNVTIKDLYMSRNDFSIILAYCSHCVLENLTISDTDGEVLLFECENNSLKDNIISNTLKAICLEYNSKNNNISYNDVSRNYVGISLYSSANNNTVYKNDAYSNKEFGMEIVSFCKGTTQRDNTLSENYIYNNRVGLFFVGNSSKNIIERNVIENNKIGFYLEKSSERNTIKDNYITKCLLPAAFIDCEMNYWSHNYWNRGRFLPKSIIGLHTIGKVPVPWVNFDKNPMNRYQ